MSDGRKPDEGLTREEKLCELARFQIAMQGYEVYGRRCAFGGWVVEATKDAIVKQGSAWRLSVALHRLMVQLPEFGPEGKGPIAGNKTIAE